MSKKTREIDIVKERVLQYVMQALMKNGFKATTMDSIASNLQMSKRTLYELFGTKDELFLEVHRHFHKKMMGKLSEIFNSSANVMEAIIRCFLYHRDLMRSISAKFIRDMQEFCNRKTDEQHDKMRLHHQNLFEVLKQGVADGYIREEVNLLVQCRMLIILMESLKRTEELFPEDISLLEIYDNVLLSFLRGISSPKGLAEIEKYKFDKLTNNIENIE